MFFRKRKPSFLAICLYSVDLPNQAKVKDRQLIVMRILALCTELFGVTPEYYDIEGPYGIKKGRPVGLKAFNNTLERKGHALYSGVTGYTDQRFGFACCYDFPLNDNAHYSELRFWYALDGQNPDVRAVVAQLALVFPIDYGYAVEVCHQEEAMMDCVHKRGWFGSSIHIDASSTGWRRAITSIFSGVVRDIYPYNVLNAAQAEALRALGFDVRDGDDEGNGSWLSFDSNEQLIAAKRAYQQSKIAPPECSQ